MAINVVETKKSPNPQKFIQKNNKKRNVPNMNV